MRRTEERVTPDGGAVVSDRPGDLAVTAERSEASAASELVGKRLVVTYPEGETPVLDGESIDVPPGYVTALVGPNGSEKSTLLKSLSNQLTPQDGVVTLDGRSIHRLGTKELARKLGLLSQENASPESLTVADLVIHGRYPHRGFLDSLTDADVEAVDRALSLAGIEHLRDREVASLSGGQKQLAWIAMVLAQETDVLLLDEPTTFLDLHHQLEVMEVIETLNAERETTIVLVLHDINQAARYAEYMVALCDGTIYARGPPDEVVSEELLAEVFGVEATVERGQWGPRITPHRAVHPREGSTDDDGDRDRSDEEEADDSTDSAGQVTDGE